jgi:hypothetical protein
MPTRQGRCFFLYYRAQQAQNVRFITLSLLETLCLISKPSVYYKN